MILAETSIMETVTTEHPVVRSFWRSLLCKHYTVSAFTIVDYREGPGWMADAYKGTACTNCGHVLDIKKVY